MTSEVFYPDNIYSNGIHLVDYNNAESWHGDVLNPYDRINDLIIEINSLKQRIESLEKKKVFQESI